MKHKKMFALALAMLSVACMMSVASDESDGLVQFADPNDVTYTFTEGQTNDIIVKIKSNEIDAVDITLTVRDVTNNKEIAKKTFSIPPNETVELRMPVSISGVGEHRLTVTGEPSSLFPPNGSVLSTITVNVTESIWSNWTTYAAIIITVLLAIIAIVYISRGSVSKKPKMTFREAERITEAETKEVEPQVSATERRKYEKAPEQKQAPPSKESSDGKLKYRSSRRK